MARTPGTTRCPSDAMTERVPGDGGRPWRLLARHIAPVLAALWVGAMVTAAARAADPAAPPADVYRCRQTPEGTIAVDGQDADPAWASASRIRLVKIKDGAAPAVASDYRFLWSDQALYVFAELEDHDIISTIDEHDGKLWSEDAIELFVNPVPEQLTPYIEFEVSPNGTFYDILVLNPRKTLQAVYEQPWKHNYEPPGVTVRTTRMAGDRPGWRVEMRVPLAAFTLTQPVPLQPGQQWRVGVFRIDKHADGTTDEYSWQVVADGRFHAPDRFGVFVFAGPADGAAPAAP